MFQEVLFGIESIFQIIDGKNVLIVRDESYDSLEIKKYFDKIPHYEFFEFTPNPLYEQVIKGIKFFNENNCDFIIAVGGGSTIDVAKCIKLFCKMDSKDFLLNLEKKDTGVPIVAIPTTAGTGSESTRHAVIYYDNEKQSISHDSIVPNYAILEPLVLKTLPLYQKKCTMLDALSQAIESWWSVNSNEESINYSMKAIQLIKGNWEDYIYDNKRESYQLIMEAANYAGRAINITATTAAHAMSYKLTSLYNLPHGHAVALCLPEVWDYMIEHIDLCIDKRGQSYFEKTLNDISVIIEIDYVRDMIKRMGIGYPVAEKKKEEVELLTKSVNSLRLKNNPVELSSDVIKKIYGRIIS